MESEILITNRLTTIRFKNKKKSSPWGSAYRTYDEQLIDNQFIDTEVYLCIYIREEFGER